MRRKAGILIILAVVLIILLTVLIMIFDSEKKAGNDLPHLPDKTTSTEFVGGNGDPSGETTEEETEAPTEEPTTGEDVELYGIIYPYDTEEIDLSGTEIGGRKVLIILLTRFRVSDGLRKSICATAVLTTKRWRD